ncbi:MAG TPA: septum site-determining protein MinC [Stellaceae bacterium]|nr:septum site-determining protein MinC [Stellaceae bacterium]
MANRVQGGIFTIMMVKIGDPYDPALETELAEQVARSPSFYADAPVVLDLKDSLGCTSAADYTILKETLRRHGLIAVGVQNASALQLRAAHAVDLAAFAGAAVNGARRAAPAERAALGPRPRLVTDPVRSGTQIYARGSDLIVVAPVSSGAEVIADGHIHVYGTLRGRAIAGASGDVAARIFAQRLEAELLAIAGRYLVSEAIAPEYLQQSAQVALIDNHLRILTGWSPARGLGSD